MLMLAQDLSTASVYAGEPIVVEMQLQNPQGVVQSMDGRAFVMAVYMSDRTIKISLPGTLLTDGSTGDYVHFETDGRFSEQMYSTNQDGLIWEISERQKNGRNVMALGSLTVLKSADPSGVPSLGNGRISPWMSRLVRREPPQSYVAASFSQNLIPYSDTSTNVPLTIGGTPPQGVQNSNYAFTPTVSGGTGTYIFSLVGTLPNGLAFSQTSGSITGSTQNSGETDDLKIVVEDSSGMSAIFGPFTILFSDQPAKPNNTYANSTKVRANNSSGFASALLDTQQKLAALDPTASRSIDFGTGSDTATGDTVYAALVKLESWVSDLEIANVGVPPGGLWNDNSLWDDTQNWKDAA